MKIFQRKDRIEGEWTPNGAIFIFGKSTLSTGKPDGWFLRFEIPISIKMNYFDPIDFIEKTAPCRFVRLWRNRPVAHLPPIFSTGWIKVPTK